MASSVYATALTEDSADASSREKTALREFPAENPTQSQLEDWLRDTRAALTTRGYNPLMRGDVLRENVTLVDQVLIPVPADPSAAVMANAKNAEITAKNTANERARNANIREYKARMEGYLTQAMRPRLRSEVRSQRQPSVNNM